MANPERGEVEFRVGEKRFTIRMTTNAVATATPYMGGKSIFDIDLSNLQYVRAVFFAMCKGQNGVDTLEDAGDLIDEDPITCQKAVNEACSLFFQRWIKSQEKKAA